VGDIPALTAEEWMSGRNAPPILVSWSSVGHLLVIWSFMLVKALL